jgi:hypothetical protein
VVSDSIEARWSGMSRNRENEKAPDGSTLEILYYKLCRGLYSRGDGGDLGKMRVSERVVVAQDGQDE